MLRRPIESAQFTSWEFTQRVHNSRLVPSMGTIGDCFDNALMEAFCPYASRTVRPANPGVVVLAWAEDVMHAVLGEEDFQGSDKNT